MLGDTFNLRDFFCLLAADNGTGSGSGGAGTGTSGDSGAGTGDNGAGASSTADADDDDSDDDDTDDSEADDDDESDSNGNADKSPAATFERLLARNGNNARGVAWQLYRQLYAARNAKREMREEADQLRTQLPRKGSIVLHKKDAAVLNDYRQLGTPQQIRERLATATRLTEEQQTAQKTETVAKAARAVGYNPAVLNEIGKNLEYEIVEVSANGQTIAQVSVVNRVKRNGTTEVERTALTDYAEKNWKVLLPALTAPEEGDTQQTNGKTWVRQAPSGGTTVQQAKQQSGSVLSQYNERYHAPKKTTK